MSSLDDILYNCVKKVLVLEGLKAKLQENKQKKYKGIEEFLYPYINAHIFQDLCKKKQTIERFGHGRISTNDRKKPDFILETRNEVVLGELKLAKTLNGLIFGYQASKSKSSEGCGKKLAQFLKNNSLLKKIKCSCSNKK